MNGHPHAKIAQQYWQEAEQDAEAWKNWEYQDEHENWYLLSSDPVFRPNYKYRRKTRTININGHEVPEPLRTVNDGQEVYMVCLESEHHYATFHYKNEDDYDRRLIARGLCHATEEAAIAHAKALLSFTQGGGLHE